MDIVEKLRKKLLQASIRGTFWRSVIQWGFLLWCLVIGVQFGLFVSGFEGGGIPTVGRPPSVEGFLPIGALISLLHWINTGAIHPAHPAAVVLLVTFLFMSLVGKKSFCSFICPVGTLSERLWRGGKKVFGKNWRIWRPLDLFMRTTKYFLLYFFINIAFFQMPSQALGGFLNGAYWAIADVKMYYFFSQISALALGVIIVLALLSLPFKNFWCRYLCPYGALLGVLSMASPWKIRRNEDACTNCGRCSRQCPFHLPVDEKKVIRSAECTGCLTCVSGCPAEGALGMAVPRLQRSLPAWVYPMFVILVFAVGVGWGMAAGHWETSLTMENYRYLVPLVDRIGH